MNLSSRLSLVLLVIIPVVQVSSGCHGSFKVGGLDRLRAPLLPAANRPHPGPLSPTRRGMTALTGGSVGSLKMKSKQQMLLGSDLHVPPAAAPAGPAAAHQAL